MRLDKKVLKKRCSHISLQDTKYLNLSGLNLVFLEHLGKCKTLHWLLACDNDLQGDSGLGKLQQLWYLDLSNNRIQNLSCLSKFLALGTLILSNNNLRWADLERLSHAHIISLSLHGNPVLDSDPYYRIHVIDSLPLIWELDGRLVTVTERLHVKQFFIDTQFTDHPVRHKTCKTFQTTSLKNIGTDGIVSSECRYIFSKFPMSETHTKHTDERRLKYLTGMVQQDILQMLEHQNTNVPLDPNFLVHLLEERYKDVEGCNMVLLLLVMSLEFQLPTSLVRACLVSAQLDMIGSVSTMSLFLLSRGHRTRVVSVLLNAAKVDRDNNVNNEGGLYPQLFMCLYYTVAQLTRIKQTSRKNLIKIKPISHNSDYIALMASEAVSLMMRNTKFFSFFNTEHGVVSLVTAATGSVSVVLDAKDKLLEADNMMGDSLPEAQEAVIKLILDAIEVRLSRINIKMEDIPVGDRYLSLSDSLPIKGLHSVIWASSFLTKGQQVPRTDPPILNPVREALKPKPVQAKMGEKVLLGPQVVGELTMLLEGGIAMARIDAVPVANGAVVSKLKSSDAHFTFVDMRSLCFDRDIGMWRPTNTVGDKYSIHSTEPRPMSSDESDERPHSSRIVDTFTAPLIYTPKEGLESPKKGPGPNRDQNGEVRGSKSLSHAMVKRVMSDSNNSFIHSQTPMPGMTVSRSTPHSRPATAHPTLKVKKRQVSSAGCSSSLHQHDNVHIIHGFTPRVDSSRSGTVISTPLTTDRCLAVMPIWKGDEKELLK